MTETKSKSFANSGVENHNGMALQRNTAIFLLLKDYKVKFKDKKYSIYYEHHDDFLFCFLNEDDDVSLIEAYQSKKKSPAQWTLTELLSNDQNIILKLLETGKRLHDDKRSKSSGYQHLLYFSSNQNIQLRSNPKHLIHENGLSLQLFKDLPDDIKKTIQEHKNISNIDSSLCSELDNLGFIYIPLQNTAGSQEKSLVGEIVELFGSKISDPKAALEALNTLFRKIEVTYSQGNEAQLSDETKSVNHKQIDEAFNILTSQAKTFNFWREQKDRVAKELNIYMRERKSFEFHFTSAFDYFKSKTNAEHENIYNFVENNIYEIDTVTEIETVFQLFELFKKINNTNFEDLQLKAILFAAVFEVSNIKESQNEISTHL